MVRSAVKVVIRTRPTPSFASKNLIIDLEHNSMQAFIPKDNTQGPINNQQENWKFKFDQILHNSTQQEVYDVCARQIVASVVHGYNGTVLAYGQTGAGKTYTMSGGAQNYKFRGIIPRAIAHLFVELQSKQEQAFTIRVSFCEIYNELIYDLLSPVPPAGQTGNIMIQDDPKYGVVVKGLQKILCNNEEEALNQLFEGQTNRTIAEHKLNKTSTRSHCVYTIHLQSRSRVQSSEKVVFSKLNLVDLAGSQRTKKTGSQGLTLTEANFINKSLTYLEQVVIAQSEKRREHVPYRQSKLTYILKDSVGGNSKTVMVANVWPEPQHIQQTISTLRFATRMMRVSNQAIINVQLDPAQLIQRYKKEIRDLKQELAMHDTLANRGRITYQPYTPQQQKQMQILAESYFDGKIEEIQIESLRQVKELFVQMRNIYRRTLARLGASNFKAQSESEEVKESRGYTREKTYKDLDQGVGEQEFIGGFGLGRANPASRPADISAFEPKSSFAQQQESEQSKQEESEIPLPSSRSVKQPPIDKNQAFMEFKNTEGKQIDQSLKSNRLDLGDKKEELKEVTSIVNSLKRQIDECKENIDRIRMRRQDDQEDVIDEQEYMFIKTMKDLKKQYRENFQVLRNLKEEVQIIARNIEYNRERMVSDFESWYEARFGVAPRQRQRNLKPGFEVSHTDEMDPDALAYISAKKHVQTVHRAKKTLGAMGRS